MKWDMYGMRGASPECDVSMKLCRRRMFGFSQFASAELSGTRSNLLRHRPLAAARPLGLRWLVLSLNRRDDSRKRSKHSAKHMQLTQGPTFTPPSIKISISKSSVEKGANCSQVMKVNVVA